MKKSNLEMAIADYNKAIELDPKIALAYRNRGNAYYQQHKLDQAISIDPNCVEAYFNRGYFYFEKRDYSHAIVDYSKAIELDPKLAMAFEGRAMAYCSIDNYDKSWSDPNFSRN